MQARQLFTSDSVDFSSWGESGIVRLILPTRGLNLTFGPRFAAAKMVLGSTGPDERFRAHVVISKAATNQAADSRAGPLAIVADDALARAARATRAIPKQSFPKGAV